MKTKPLLIVLSLITFSFVNAQEYSIGVKGGLNYNSIGELYHYGNDSGLGTNVTPNDDTVFSGEKEMGTQLGAFLMIGFDTFFIRPEINYVSSKNNYPLASKTANWTSTKIDIPILFGYKIYNPVSIYAGPSFSSISDMKLEGVEEDPKYPFTYKKSSTSINAGLLVDFGRFGFDLRYQYSITKFEKIRVNIDRGIYGTNIADLLEYNPSQISISVHVNLVKFNGFGKSNRNSYNWRNHKNL